MDDCQIFNIAPSITKKVFAVSVIIPISADSSIDIYNITVFLDTKIKIRGFMKYMDFNAVKNIFHYFIKMMSKGLVIFAIGMTISLLYSKDNHI